MAADCQAVAMYENALVSIRNHVAAADVQSIARLRVCADGDLTLIRSLAGALEL